MWGFESPLGHFFIHNMNKKINSNQKIYDENEIDKVIISDDSVENIYENLKTLSVPKIISTYPSLDPKRAVTITSGLFLVKNLLKKYKITQLKVSKSDILEGLILKYF